MNLAQWTATIITHLKAEGFDASEHQGFPLVKRPETLALTERLLNFSVFDVTGFPADRTIYAEGMLFIPAGARAAAEQLRIAAKKTQEG